MTKLKMISTFSLIFLFSFGMVVAQDTTMQRSPQSKDHPANPQMKKSGNDDFDSRMAKLQEETSKLQAKAGKVRDPQMKADLTALLAKMNTANNDYNSMKSNSALSPEQQKDSQKKIQAEMQEIRTMHDNMKAKYGDKAGGGKKGGAKGSKPSNADEPAQSGEDLK